MSVDLAYTSYGEPGREVLVLIHGLFASKENFHTLARRLADRYLIYSLDLRNHGDSPHTDEMDFTLMAEDVVGFFDSQGIDKAFVLGHSLGGKTAMTLALQYPERVSGLLVEDMSPRTYAASLQRELQALRDLPVDTIERRKEAEEWMIPRIGNRAVALFLLKNLVTKPEGGFKLRLNIEAIRDNYPRLLEFKLQDRSYSGPALFIKGGASPFMQAGDEKLIQGYFPSARLEVLADASHWVHAEKMDEVEQLVRDFIRS